MSDLIQLVCKSPSGSRPYFYLGTCDKRDINVPDNVDYWECHIPSYTTRSFIDNQFDYSLTEENRVRFERLVPYISRLPFEIVLIRGSYQEASGVFNSMVEVGIAREDHHSMSTNGIVGFSEYCEYMVDNNMENELHEEIKSEMKHNPLIRYVFVKNGSVML